MDMYQSKHEDDKSFSTHINGSKRIDMLLCTANILDYVVNAGYLKYHEAFDTDHRAIYCDLSKEILRIPEIEIQEKVRLVGTNSTNKEGARYIRKLYRHLLENNVFYKVEKLYNKSKEQNADTEMIMTEINKLDEMITASMIRIEQKTCAKKDPAIWSPSLRQSNLTIQYWNVLIKGHRNQINVKTRIQRIINKMTEETKQHLRTHKGSMKLALKNALKNHSRLVNDSVKLRREYLLQRLKDLTEREEKSRTTPLKQLLHREQTRSDFAYIKTVFKANKSKGIRYIEVPDPNNINRWIEISEPNEIIQYLLVRNALHFGQAQGTPFTIEPLASYFGYKGTNNNSQRLINNKELEIDTSSMSEATYHLIDILKNGRKINKDIQGVTYEEFVQGFIGKDHNIPQ
jgi:hypothetical protein